MSSTSTPSRARPPLLIPGLDKKPNFDGNNSMMGIHGLPTPPQSALESRRPSLQFSSMPDYTGSVGSYSQPSTPIRGLSRQSDTYSHAWTDHAATTANTPSHLVNSFSAARLSQPSLEPAFQPQQSFQPLKMDDMSPYAEAGASQVEDSFGSSIAPHHGMWASQQIQEPLSIEASSDLGPPLFAISHSLGPDVNGHDPLGIQNASTYHTQPFAAPVGSFHGYSAVHNSMYSQPQVIVPSQLSPQDDFAQQHYHALTSPCHGPEGYSTSFSSSTASLGDFEIIRGPSPTSAYFDKSDSEDYISIKNEHENGSPSFHASLRRSGTRTTSVRRRPGPKRTRNAATSDTWSHYIGNTEVVCENFNPVHGPPIRKGTAPEKKFRCTYLNANGTACSASFDRSEHLKRHAGKHSNVRHYPCPLPGCDKHIQRPDNAADHFKTHLQPPKPGKRNHHFDWVFVRQAILKEYTDQKRAHKLIDNLQKWIDAGMPESASQRRGATAAQPVSGGARRVCKREEEDDVASMRCNASVARGGF